jgi:hypothetical protein
MKPSGHITIHPHQAGRPVTRGELLLWLPAPASLTPLRVKVSVNSVYATDLTITPSPEPKRYSIPVPRGPSPTLGDPGLNIDLETTGWRPRDHGMGDDARTLSIMVCLKQIGLVCKA